MRVEKWIRHSLGAGERLFGVTSDKKPMRLVDSKTIGDGLAFLI